MTKEVEKQMLRVGYSTEYVAAIRRAEDAFRAKWIEADRPVYFDPKDRAIGIDAMPLGVQRWAFEIFEEELAGGYELSYAQLNVAWFAVWDEWNAGTAA